jgi:hypothetical protein
MKYTLAELGSRCAANSDLRFFMCDMHNSSFNMGLRDLGKTEIWDFAREFLGRSYGEILMCFSIVLSRSLMVLC